MRDFCHSTFWREASSAPFLFNFLLKIYTKIKKLLLPRGQSTVCDCSSTRCTVIAPWLSKTSPADLESSCSMLFFHGSSISSQLNPKIVPLLLLIILRQKKTSLPHLWALGHICSLTCLCFPGMAVLGSSATFQGLQIFSQSTAFLVQISYSERAKEKGKDAFIFKLCWYSGSPDLFNQWQYGKRIAAIYWKEKTRMVVSSVFRFSAHLSILFLAWQLLSEMYCILSWHQYLLSSHKKRRQPEQGPYSAVCGSYSTASSQFISSAMTDTKSQNHQPCG